MANQRKRLAGDRSDHSGAEVVSAVFKVLAVIILFAGIVGSVVAAFELERHTANRGLAVGVAIGGIVGSIVSASSVAFFAYVLDLLMDIEWHSYTAAHRNR